MSISTLQPYQTSKTFTDERYGYSAAYGRYPVCGGSLISVAEKASQLSTAQNSTIGVGAFVDMHEFDPGSTCSTKSITGISDSDSGVSDVGGVEVQSNVPLLELGSTQKRCFELLKELRAFTLLTNDFRDDVIEDRQAANDLLGEYRTKIQPFLIQVDEELVYQEQLLQSNIDQCKISDERIDWLLHFHRYVLQFRALLKALQESVYNPLEHLLNKFVRGAKEDQVDISCISRCLLHALQELESVERQLRYKQQRCAKFQS